MKVNSASKSKIVRVDVLLVLGFKPKTIRVGVLLVLTNLELSH